MKCIDHKKTFVTPLADVPDADQPEAEATLRDAMKLFYREPVNEVMIALLMMSDLLIADEFTPEISDRWTEAIGKFAGDGYQIPCHGSFDQVYDRAEALVDKLYNKLLEGHSASVVKLTVYSLINHIWTMLYGEPASVKFLDMANTFFESLGVDGTVN